MGPEDGAGMPAARQHLTAMQRPPDARPDLEAGDGAAQEFGAADARPLRGAGEERRDDHRGAVQRRLRVVIVELEALDEGAVEEGRARRARRPSPADDRGIAAALEIARQLDGE